jgi:hypothetical protein
MSSFFQGDQNILKNEYSKYIMKLDFPDDNCDDKRKVFIKIKSNESINLNKDLLHIDFDVYEFDLVTNNACKKISPNYSLEFDETFVKEYELDLGNYLIISNRSSIEFEVRSEWIVSLEQYIVNAMDDSLPFEDDNETMNRKKFFETFLHLTEKRPAGNQSIFEEPFQPGFYDWTPDIDKFYKKFHREYQPLVYPVNGIDSLTPNYNSLN